MKNSEEQAWKRRTAEQALQHAAGLLKRCDRLELWKLTARLSLHESLTPIQDPLFALPTLNAEIIRLLSHTVLASGASDNQTGKLPDDEDFRKILNDCNHGLYDPDEMNLLAAASSPSLQGQVELERFLVRLGATQFRSQDPPWERAGRLVGMLEVLGPRYPDRVPEGQRVNVQRVLAHVEQVLGARVSVLALGFQDIVVWETFTHRKSLAALRAYAPPFLDSNASQEELLRRRAQIICAYLNPEPSLDNYLVFTVSQLLARFDLQSPGYSISARPRVEAFMRLAARSPEELRDLLSFPHFRIGHPGKRLSPLERFPIVRLDSAAGEEPRYLVPNYRHLIKSFDSAIDLTLLEALGNDYEQARGALFHLYLRQLIENRLPQVIVIPETRYATAMGGKDSPDLTLLELSPGRLVPIEVKARQINLETRLVLGDEELRRNLDDAFKALCKLPSKIADLRSDRPEFARWRKEIKRTEDIEPILIVVIREGLHLLFPLLRKQAISQADHPLNGLTEPYCILSADEFERIVEAVHRGGGSLSTRLTEHYIASGLHENNAATGSSEDLLLSAPDSFATSFLKMRESATDRYSPG